MKRFIGSLAVVFCALFAFSSMGRAQIFSSNTRRAVVLEAFYALRTQHDGGCNAYIRGNCISTWNFLHDPNQWPSNAYGTVKGWYGCNPSVWAIQVTDGCPNGSGLASPPSFYSNVASYGLSTGGGYYGNVGRGGQCTFFANLVLYRSGGISYSFPALWQMAQSVDIDTNLQHAVEGDIVQAYNDGAFPNHIAIVVQIYRNGSQVVALDLIDSNYISDTTQPPAYPREVIARHAFCTVGAGQGCPFSSANIQGHFHIWKETPYYNTSYNPNA